MTIFVPSPGLEAELARTADMREAMRRQAEHVLAEAQRLAEPHVESGAYLASLHADVEEVDGKAEGRVIAGTDHWSYVEFGTSRMAAQRILRRALEGGGE